MLKIRVCTRIRCNADPSRDAPPTLQLNLQHAAQLQPKRKAAVIVTTLNVVHICPHATALTSEKANIKRPNCTLHPHSCSESCTAHTARGCKLQKFGYGPFTTRCGSLLDPTALETAADAHPVQLSTRSRPLVQHPSCVIPADATNSGLPRCRKRHRGNCPVHAAYPPAAAPRCSLIRIHWLAALRCRVPRSPRQPPPPPPSRPNCGPGRCAAQPLGCPRPHAGAGLLGNPHSERAA